MNTSSSAVDRWIFEEYDVSERSLALSRIFVALHLLLCGMPRYLWMDSIADSFYSPPLGLGVFLKGPAPYWLIWVIMAGITILGLALLVGWRTRMSALGLAFLLLLGNSLTYVFGKIDHDILFITTLIILAIAPTNRCFSYDAAHRPPTGPAPRWPLALHALIVSLAMFSSAIPKITTGWLDPATQSVKGHFVFNLLASERPTLLGEFMLAHFPSSVWELMDWSTIILECALLPAMFSLRAMRIVCAFAVFFHVGIHFSMEIFFAQNLLAYSLFVEWDRILKVDWVERLFSAAQRLMAGVRGWMFPAVGIPLAVLYTYTDNPVAAFLFLFGPGVWIRDSALALLALGIAAWYLAHVASGWVAARRKPAAPATDAAKPPIILFDGVCGLCNRFVDRVIRHDTKGRFRFAPLQSAPGQELLISHGLPRDYIDSIVLVQNGKAYRYSTAALMILKQLGLPWSLTGLLLLLPANLRDIGYDLIAKRRYRWFGRSEQCRIPSAAERARFLA